MESTRYGWLANGRCYYDGASNEISSQTKGSNFQPGEEYLYCNTGFTLLAEVVEKVSGMSFAEFT